GFTDNSGGQDNSYLFDRVTGAITLLSHAVGTATGGSDRQSYMPEISADGRFIAFESDASNLIAGYSKPPNSYYGDVYLYDRIAGTTTLVSHTTASNTQGGS